MVKYEVYIWNKEFTQQGNVVATWVGNAEDSGEAKLKALSWYLDGWINGSDYYYCDAYEVKE